MAFEGIGRFRASKPSSNWCNQTHRGKMVFLNFWMAGSHSLSSPSDGMMAVGVRSLRLLAIS